MATLREKLQLHKRRQEKALQDNQVVKKAQQLLLEEDARSKSALRYLGLDHHLNFERRSKHDYNRSKLAEAVYNTDTFTGEQIKVLCNKYDMRLLPTEHYIGNIPSDLGRVINEFGQKHSINLDNEGKMHFFIMAPASSFRYDRRPQPPKVKDEDPILFYRHRDDGKTGPKAREKDLFVRVHDWGNDFSFFRQLLPMFSMYYPEDDSEQLTNLQRTTIIIVMLLLLFAFGLWSESITMYYIVGFLTLVVAMSQSYGLFSNDNSHSKSWNDHTR